MHNIWLVIGAIFLIGSPIIGIIVGFFLDEFRKDYDLYADNYILAIGASFILAIISFLIAAFGSIVLYIIASVVIITIVLTFLLKKKKTIASNMKKTITFK